MLQRFKKNTAFGCKVKPTLKKNTETGCSEEIGFHICVFNIQKKVLFAVFALELLSFHKNVITLTTILMEHESDVDMAQNFLNLAKCFNEVLEFIQTNDATKAFGIEFTDTSYPHGMDYPDLKKIILIRILKLVKSFLYDGHWFLPAAGKT